MASVTDFNDQAQTRGARAPKQRAAWDWMPRFSWARAARRLQDFMDRRIDRMALARLEQLDEQTLRDIGVTREEVAEAMAMPIGEDAHGALDAKRQARLKNRGDW